MHTNARKGDRRRMPAALSVGTPVGINNPDSPIKMSIGYVSMVDGGGWIYVDWWPDISVQSHLRPSQTFRLTKEEFIGHYQTLTGHPPGQILMETIHD